MSVLQIEAAMAALARGDLASAETHAQQAIADRAEDGATWRALGLVLQTAGRDLEAFEAYEVALKFSPDDDGVAAALTRVALRLGLRDVALQLALHVATRRPDDVQASIAVCDVLLSLDRAAEAAAVVTEALAATPGDPDLVHAAGRISRTLGRLDDAIALFRAVLDLRPADPRLRYDLAWSLADAGQLSDALAQCDLALDGRPDPETRAALAFLRSTVLLGQGHLKDGWSAYEARLDLALPSAPQFDLHLPRWDPPTPLEGRTLLVMAEQGLGDEIAFLGMTGDLLARLGTREPLELCVDRRLCGLVERSWPGVRALPHATEEIHGRRHRRPGTVPMAEMWAPMGDLLACLRPDLAAFQRVEGYLTPDPARAAHWMFWLKTLSAQRTIGISWRSRKMLDGRSRNFAAPQDWTAILRTPDTTFVSLQYGADREELDALAREAGTTVHAPPGLDLFDDLEGLAALASVLDLVIGFSNASTNLAGAVGAPLWLLTPPAPWTALGADDYPWYPQARRFTAQHYADWAPVMDDVAAALAAS